MKNTENGTVKNTWSRRSVETGFLPDPWTVLFPVAGDTTSRITHQQWGQDRIVERPPRLDAHRTRGEQPKGEQGFALPVVSAFEALNTPRTERILIRNPGNPTGYMISRSELESLRSIVRKHDLYHFADVTD